METLRLGVIGVGNVVRSLHLQTLRRLPDCTVAAVAEADPGRRAEAARLLPGAAVVPGWQELLAGSAVDAVLVCLPGPHQVDAAVAALESGLHVYVEKPIATSLAGAGAVLEAWRRAGTVGMAGLNYRLHPHYRRAREVVRSGRLGRVVAARTVFSIPASVAQPSWKGARESGGGVLYDLGSHHADLVRFVLGQEVSSVHAGLRSQRGDDDTAAVELTLADGTLVQSLLSLSAVDEERFEVYGSEGKLTVDRTYALDVEVRPATRERDRLRRVGRAARRLRHAPFLVTRTRAPAHEPSYPLALERFVAAVRGRAEAEPDLLDGYRSLAVVEAAAESARLGAPVDVAGAPAAVPA